MTDFLISILARNPWLAALMVPGVLLVFKVERKVLKVLGVFLVLIGLCSALFWTLLYFFQPPMN